MAKSRDHHLLFVGLDDTDTLQSRGTGHLAREIATALAADYRVLGVTRHQLLIDPRVPCTAKNSSAAIVLAPDGHHDLATLITRISTVVRERHSPGSDPGLCIADRVPDEVTAFGRCVQKALVTQKVARDLAAAHTLRLVGLGGDESGVIGALAAVGLAASGDDGRYVLVGCSRELRGLVSVSAVLEAGIAEVRTLDGLRVREGLVLADKLRPARRGGQPIAFVERCPEPVDDSTGEHWRPLRLD